MLMSFVNFLGGIDVRRCRPKSCISPALFDKRLHSVNRALTLYNPNNRTP